MKVQSFSKGFTLIELVVVIVILGILSATAIPKFMSLQSDARISTLNGLLGAVKSAVNNTYAKSIIKGVDRKAKGEFVCAIGDMCELESPERVSLAYGRPAAQIENGGLINALMDGSNNFSKDLENTDTDWFVKLYKTRTDNTPASIMIWPRGASEPLDTYQGCGIMYTEAYSTGSIIENPTVTIIDVDC